jgi:hypothetical protein
MIRDGFEGACVLSDASPVTAPSVQPLAAGLYPFTGVGCTPNVCHPSARGDADTLTRGEALALVAIAREATTNLPDDLEALLRG